MASTNDHPYIDLKVAIIHYWFVTWRGGERVVKSILDLFPNADVYTLFYDPKECSRYLREHKVYSSAFDLPVLRKQYQKLFPFYPAAINSLKLKGKYDLLISSESGPAKGIKNPMKIPHLCYIHSPMRYCWGSTDVYLKSLPKFSRKLVAAQFERLRKWDETTIGNVDRYVANSKNIQNKVKKFYHRDSSICHPPISLDLFSSPLTKNEKSYYLSFGAITPYKRIDLLIDVFNRLKDQRLIVIGEGAERSKLEKRASDNVLFLGTQDWESIKDYIQGAKALLFPGEEDFGMIPLEVMALGVPVIAYKKGGALETVIQEKEIDRSTGIFFESQTMESLENAINFFENNHNQFNSEFIRSHARKFGEDFFQESFIKEVSKVL